ncbi:MAG: AEC family transporter [Myxacorys californica WJT36-NPBG1]|jgi:hypothetical protein|nr:AEC family transporter [Myxacorys californica WJT36-NPBG1]
MIEVLLHAYTPLILWTGLGAIALRFLPQTFPRLLGRSLYWVGVPWQLFGLARHTHFDPTLSLAPVVTIATLGVGIVLAWLTLRGLIALKQSRSNVWMPPIPPLDSPHQGTFVIASMLGNTGFIGLGIIPTLLQAGDMSWAVLFSVTQNLVGTYGVGVLLASYYGRSEQPNHWWMLLRDMVTVPTLWAFAAGYLTQSVEFAPWGSAIADSALLFVIPTSFVLMGMRLGQLQGLNSLKVAAIPVFLKVLVLPALVGIGTTLLGLSGDTRLSLILMAGTPSAFASLILAEEYNLDRDLAASCIALSTVSMLLTIPLWLLIF